MQNINKSPAEVMEELMQVYKVPIDKQVKKTTIVCLHLFPGTYIKEEKKCI